MKPSILLRSAAMAALIANMLGEVPFSPPQPIAGDPRTQLLALRCAADVTGNGRPEVVGSKLVYGRQYLFIWENDPPLREHFDSVLAQAREVNATSVADIDLDGRMDVVWGGLNSVGWAGIGGANIIDDIDRGGVATADIDGDGDIDVVGSNGLDLSWYENPGPPSKAAWIAHRIAGFNHMWVQVAAGDVDRDGDPDLVVVGRPADGYRLALWRNLGGGVSWSEELLDTTFWCANSQPTIVDLDGDGDLDLVVAQEPGIRWWENRDGKGNVWESHAIASGDLDTPQLLDLDNDGDLDLLVSPRSDSPAVEWWEQRAGADSVSWLPHRLASDDYNVRRVLWEDFDSDGDIDCVYQTSGPDSNRGNVIYLRENLTLHRSAAFPIQHTVATGFGDTRSVLAADLNHDGLIDLLGASHDTGTLRLWLNFDGSGSSWWRTTVDAHISGLEALAVGDIDRDGDLDIVGAASGAGAVVWWANDGGTVPTWTRRTIASGFEARDVAVADFDRDGYLDVVSLDRARDLVVWWRNDSTPNDGGWVGNDVTAALRGPEALAVGDVDGDGDADLVVAAGIGNEVKWFENLEIVGTRVFWPRDVGTVARPRDVALADLDFDGDQDILVAALDSDELLWFENLGGHPPTWKRHVLADGVTGILGLVTGDFDRDGDIDVGAVGVEAGPLRWWENRAGDASTWLSHEGSAAWPAVGAMVAGDLDGDGDLDLAGVSGSASDQIVWWPNLGGQVGVEQSPASEVTLHEAQTRELLALRVSHRGRTRDGPLAIRRLELRIEREDGAPLSQVELDTLISNWEIYRDTGFGRLDASDLPLLPATAPVLADGTLRFQFSAGDPVSVIAAAESTWLFVVATAAPSAFSSAVRAIRVHAEFDGAFVDREHNLPLTLERPDLHPVRVLIGPSLPDLVVDQLEPASPFVAGAPAQASFRITNRGMVPIAGVWQDSLYLSRDAVLERTDRLLATRPAPAGLAAGGTYAGSFDFTLPMVAAGDYYLIAKADYGNALLESAEFNNTRASAAVPLTIPTLLPTGSWPGFRRQEAHDVCVLGSTAYVAVSGGLWILDVADPTLPTWRAGLDTICNEARGIAVHGNYAALAAGAAGLQILSIAYPDHPFRVGALPLPGFARHVCLRSGTAYVDLAQAGIAIIDWSDPAFPELRSIYSANVTGGIQVEGGLCYVGLAGGLEVLDVSSPPSPAPLGFFPTTSPVRDLQVVDGRAYLATGVGLEIVKVETPASMLPLGSVTIPGGCLQVYVTDSTAHLAAADLSLRTFDISNPGQPVPCGQCRLRGQASGLHASSGFAYVAGMEFGVDIMRIGEGGQPVTSGSFAASGNALDVVVARGRAYVADGPGGVRILDVTDPASPVELGTHLTPAPAGCVALAGQYVYAGGWDGLHIIDVHDPAAPQAVSHPFDFRTVRQIEIRDNRALILSGYSFLSEVTVLDVTDPASPVQSAAYTPTGELLQLRADRDHAYLAMGLGGLEILDLNNFINPTLVGTYSPENAVHGVDIQPGRAYLAVGSAGLELVNVEDLTSPAMLARWTLPDDAYVQVVRVPDDRLFVISTSGLHWMQAADAAPFPQANFMPGAFHHLEVDGANVFLAAGEAGLLILREPADEPPAFTGIERSETSVGLSWNLPGTGLMLEWTSHLSDPESWQPIPVQLGQTRLDLPIPSPTAYFRLVPR